ncbi:hypothetical protein [Xanthomonas campestris]|uniref:hypothetical protein n=1 Tax=Xanthomonas campestris TaxID=339 RepID=UPI001D156968|nr:hypothetical protein [Xanthomonas campestris]MCC3253806.1 hypothetical protein [Xanthomonas campestris pv. armoraciae]
MYQQSHLEEKSSRSVGSILTDGKEFMFNSTQTQTKEERMNNLSFNINLKSKWVVGLSVLTSLGLCGVCLTQPHDTFYPDNLFQLRGLAQP